MKIINISVARDFTDSPGARYRTDGSYSGQEFYEEILKPRFEEIWDNDSKIFLDIDGVVAYASSFISEAFTRLKRDFKDVDKIREKIDVKSDDDPMLLEIIDDVLDSNNP